MKKDYILFRVVPTMRCNFRCDYCFVANDVKAGKTTMFDNHPVEEWIEAMRQYEDKDIEFYFWGGEPFVLDDVYTLVREWTKMDHVLPGCRIDTNVFYAEKIAKLCPSNKIKLNCSYHMKYHTLDEQFEKIKLLKDLDMVGMMNFVASEYNLNKLKNEYNMTVSDLIDKFNAINVFVNIAGDFAIANNINHPRHDEYKEFILQFISPEEWTFLRAEKEPCKCEAGKYFYTVHEDGHLTSCIDDNNYGNFFEGTVNAGRRKKMCTSRCASLISYPFREDNDFNYRGNLVEYAQRNKEYRADYRGHYNNFEF